MRLLTTIIFFVLFLGLFGFLTVNAVNVNLEFTPDCPSNIPGDCPDDDAVSKDIGSYIKRIYQFGVGISGVLAVGMIVAGAIYYSVSAGSPDKQNDAKSMITSALWGVALLLGSFLILNTINPQIVKLEPPGGALPTTCGAGEKPGIDCLPAPSSVLSRICSDLKVEDRRPGENCSPACGENERACELGESVGDGTPACRACVYARPKCPDAVVNGCKTNVVYKTGEIQIPACNSGRSDNGRLMGNCSENIAKTSSAGGTNPNLIDGAYIEHAYYPSKKGREAAECLIDYYKKNVENDKDWERTNLTGLISCL